ncbi:MULTISPECIES: hypothetical protein [Selenomonas]|uniref:hypothetical protein n=1 Tax=Selenomonas TaxID=970 RepID=UPI001655F480|nr:MULTISPECIES: hypothetical protein [unclassified Selenomonas]MBQ1867717.1 hypothetical protein [Selenomonas sp.]
MKKMLQLKKMRCGEMQKPMEEIIMPKEMFGARLCRMMFMCASLKAVRIPLL